MEEENEMMRGVPGKATASDKTNYEAECQLLELEMLKKQNQQRDIEIEYRKVQLAILKQSLEKRDS